MALQAGISTSKVLVLAGAGWTVSVVLRSGRLSELIAQLQVLLRGVDEAEISSDKYDSAALTAQIRQLAQEIRELAVSHPVTVFNGNSASSGSYASYLVPAAALGAMGYCYMWWKGWSLSDVMFVTKHNMANAVATVSKQLENVNEALSATKRHLTQKLENLDWKVEEHKETSKLIANDVNEVKSNLSQIGFDVESIHQMLSGLEGKIELLESKQDMTNSGLWYLCEVGGGFKDGLNAKLFKDVGDTIANHSTITFEENSLKGLQFIAETKDLGVIDKSTKTTRIIDLDNFPGEKARTLKNRIHRLKKKEIESFAQSAEDVLRAVEESVKLQLGSSMQSSLEAVADQPSKPTCERVKIVISIQDKDGTKQFRIYTDDKFERLFKMYSDKIKLDIQNLVFSFDGDKINPAATPDDLGMEENDIIEVHVKSS